VTFSSDSCASVVVFLPNGSSVSTRQPYLSSDSRTHALPRSGLCVATVEDREGEEEGGEARMGSGGQRPRSTRAMALGVGRNSLHCRSRLTFIHELAYGVALGLKLNSVRH
jgi:hypothetical protein